MSVRKFNVYGMSCAACAARIEKAVKAVEGVTECSVSLLTNTMGVQGSAEDAVIEQAVKNAGYEASSFSVKKTVLKENKSVEKSETQNLLRRLLFSLFFLLCLMYSGMGNRMYGLPLPAWFSGNFTAIALVQLFLCSVIMIINRKFFSSGFRAALHLSPNMDTLVALGSGISFLYSVINLFRITDAVLHNTDRADFFMDNLYFESAAMILTLITVGKFLESVSKGKTGDALRSLMNLAPKKALVLRNSKETEVDSSKIEEGDVFILKPGFSVPADGIVLEGSSAVNESSLTGESIPVEKEEGSKVNAGTVNVSGFLKCRAVKVGSETFLSRIIELVRDCSATKAPSARIADKVSLWFVPGVILVSFAAFIAWLFMGESFSFALERAVSVLVISCPCALGLATPVAIMVGNGKGAKNGILFKTGEALELTGKVKTIVFDKTGTLTKGKPSVSKIIPLESTEEELLKTACSLESKSEHPLAKALLTYAEEKELKLYDVSDFKITGGRGVEGTVNGKKVYGGNLHFIKEKISLNEMQKFELSVKELSKEGHTPLIFSKEDTVLGIICVQDEVREESAEAVKQLKELGINAVMLTGDTEETARSVAEKTGITTVIAGVLPDRKAEAVNELKKDGLVCMTGDGINDAPALASSDIGIAIGAGSDTALEAADVVLVKSNLLDVCSAVRLSRHTVRNIRENLFWAFFYNVICIPLAAGVFIKSFGWQLKPVLGAAAMSLSSFCVVTNALRLNFVRLKKYIHKKPESVIIENKESVMEKEFKVEGMMCSHCEMHVKDALLKINGVTSAEASHESGKVKIISSKEISDSKVRAAVEGAGYKII